MSAGAQAVIPAISRRRQRDIFRGDLPDRPYCMARVDGRPAGHMRIRPRIIAQRFPYIQINPPWVTVCLTFDIDRDGGAGAWMAAELPEPLASASNRANGHAHLIYALSAPVMTGPEARRRPVNLMAAIYGAMTERMDADSAYTGLIAKNPLHRGWRNLWSREPARYELKFLADWLDDREIDRHWPWKRNRKHLTGVGRNVDTFNAVRLWSYRAIRDYWPVGDERFRPAFDAWLDAVICRAESFNAEEYVADPKGPMAFSECRAIGKSIAKWTWAHFDPETLAVLKSRAGRRSGIKSGLVRRAAVADRDAAIIEARMAGATQAALAAAHGLSISGIRHVLSRAGL